MARYGLPEIRRKSEAIVANFIAGGRP
ncbi:hypothetical protein ALC53_12261 [Atta colombica]|uniref:Uncharacterized protein n=1 Tax=Atta colombica TaxID=520822 RepID=A0A195AZ17_9HYME|nr:hypothetical protein ALC53_12261 [Atta colombica]